MTVKIGCCGLIFDRKTAEILCIECAKGRGLILPGGKFEPEKDNGFGETMIRELQEETGVIAKKMYPIFHALAPDGYYDYTFLISDWDESGIVEETSEGKVVWATRPQSQIFNPYYELMFIALQEHPQLLNDCFEREG